MIIINKTLVLQVISFIILVLMFGGLVATSTVYTDIKSQIVDTTCFSCIKMDPVVISDFTFETVEDTTHPDFVLQNLSTGPLFLAFRADVCHACDLMDPVLKDVFNVDFGKKELFYKQIIFDNTTVNFYHINIDPPHETEEEAFYVYDKDQRGGVPMFVMITLGDDNGVIKPYYTTVYSTLGLKDDQSRKMFLSDVIDQGIIFYNKNFE